MKRKINYLIFILLITVLSVSAQERKAYGKFMDDVPGTKKIKKDVADKKYFRAVSSGESSKMETAKLKARTSAAAELAKQVEITVKAVTKTFINEMEVSGKMESESQLEDMVVTSAKQTLQGLPIMGYEVYAKKNKKTKKFTYTAFVMMQVNKEEILEQINKNISSNEEAKLQYDKNKFQEVFDKEMDKNPPADEE